MELKQELMSVFFLLAVALQKMPNLAIINVDEIVIIR
ncbi:MAG: hypothetical protein UV73_C0002G0050 [Candidatus Gottesmanbacteria bacterium GW2011_GWA2_43_14]|uniref:Uncharacterized protein n=1 Tax=Candidatus Gottesmanbacteria bacterium GW2011_GWA2_43_14 TaxID=1618443 RepID=A0A0G1FTI4_9BACT|nr:MAG: hypothetical protein UV73_C0002G0050 [Candidatus Gottesmanbacteria bacterium GW2011_GWA2_43_14]